MTSLSWLRVLDPDDVAAITDLLDAAERVDGGSGVSEDVRLTLRPGVGPGALSHLVAREGSVVVGYAALGGDGSHRQAELVVHPRHRRAGVGTTLVGELSVTTPAPTHLDIWAHGDSLAAAALAAAAGFERARVLLQLRRPLRPAVGTHPQGPQGSMDDDLPAPTVPSGVVIRPFEVGRDEAAWLEINAAAFASHPEQGRWTIDDLRAREAEPWFDPAGFFLAERAGMLVGFHWTKVHRVDPMPPAGLDGSPEGLPAPIGEVYVVGVAPAAGASGLGQVLTTVGLRYLRARGLAAVMLYVDEDNERAVRLYTRLGFHRHNTDVSYRRVAPGRDRD